VKLLSLLLISLVFTGCACHPREVQVRVEVPIPVPCKVAPIEKPIFLLQEAKQEESFGTKLKKALSEIETRKGYETKLEAAVRSCQ
jgi:hypothetical protein